MPRDFQHRRYIFLNSKRDSALSTFRRASKRNESKAQPMRAAKCLGIVENDERTYVNVTW